jgi:hypothetical protein
MKILGKLFHHHSMKNGNKEAKIKLGFYFKTGKYKICDSVKNILP